jgi:hypothetical protein
MEWAMQLEVEKGGASEAMAMSQNDVIAWLRDAEYGKGSKEEFQRKETTKKYIAKNQEALDKAVEKNQCLRMKACRLVFPQDKKETYFRISGYNTGK